MSVLLPNDGAIYPCTFAEEGRRCEKNAARGLTQEDYTVATRLAPWRTTFMRAMCIEHLQVVEAMIEDARL